MQALLATNKLLFLTGIERTKKHRKEVLVTLLFYKKVETMKTKKATELEGRFPIPKWIITTKAQNYSATSKDKLH